METMNTKVKKSFKGNIPAIVFYTLAAIFVLYGAYMIYSVYDYLVTYYANYNTTMSAQLGDTIQYFIANCSPYFVYAVLCYGLGTIMQMVVGLKKNLLQLPEMEPIVQVEEAEEK